MNVVEKRIMYSQIILEMDSNKNSSYKDTFYICSDKIRNDNELKDDIRRKYADSVTH